MQILKNNLKNKFIVLTLCFTLIFTSFNYKKSYADGGVISLPMLATISTLALGTGIVLKNIDDIYDLGRIFYEHNKATWDTIQSTFQSSVAFNTVTNKLSVDKPFMDIVKNTFSKIFSSSSNSNINTFYLEGIPSTYCLSLSQQQKFISTYTDFSIDKDNGVIRIGDVYIKSSTGSFRSGSSYNFYNSSGEVIGNNKVTVFLTNSPSIAKGAIIDYNKYYYYFYPDANFYLNLGSSLSFVQELFGYSNTLDYSGTYDDTFLDKEEDIYIPGNLGDIVGGNPSDVVGDNAPGWVGNGDISLPTVDNPSVSVDTSISFPGVGVENPPSDIPGVENPPSDIPNEGIWATIRDFIISLVVPSDTFWTDTWNGLYNNFTGSFPSVNMDGFNDLVTGEKKFPNIDINIMGVKGRVVNGDVINSIVDWLRPIIAGFMMLCLMFFNYRKIYKLIRNSEPFGGIAPGTSDFRTGISEYSDNYSKSKEIIGDNLRIMVSKGGK